MQSETLIHIQFKTRQTNKQNPQTGVVIEAGMLQGFQKKARVRHAAVSGQMRVWQMGTIIHRPAIRGAIVGHRHMDIRSAGPVRFLFFGLHGKPRACTILGGSTESSVTGRQGYQYLLFRTHLITPDYLQGSLTMCSAGSELQMSQDTGDLRPPVMGFLFRPWRESQWVDGTTIHHSDSDLWH